MKIGVLGAGTLGRAVAETCLAAGHTVSLYDEEATAVMDAVDDIEVRLAGDAPDRLDATTDLDAAVSGAAVAVETATADAGALQSTFAEIEEVVDRETLVATAAPGVSVTAAAAGLRHPDRAVGLRFRNPPEAPLVAVVVADQTAREACERAASFVREIDSSPVVVRDSPGAVGPRVALAAEAEAMRAVEDGVAGVEAVDATFERGYGHAAGPLERADRAGLDARLETLEHLHAELGERFEPPAILRERVAAGKTGLPSGEGFYLWENGEPTEPAFPDPELPRREGVGDDPGRE